MAAPDWRILLIGGHSGAGKTYLANKLVHQLGISALMVDDIRIALQQVTTPSQQPDLHCFLHYQPEQWLEPELIVQDWLRVAQILLKPLSEIMAHHLVVEGSGPLIIEGDGILPALTTANSFTDNGTDPKVQAIFLVEPNEATLLNNLCQRDRNPSPSSRERHKAFARASWLFGQWLSQEASNHQIPVLTPQPRETLLARLFELIS